MTEKTNKKIDWSSLWKKEDWWAVWIGFVVLLLGAARWLPSLPQISKWADLTKSFPAGSRRPPVVAGAGQTGPTAGASRRWDGGQ